MPLFIVLPLQFVMFLVFAVTPYVNRKSENFGIKTPEEQYATPAMRALRKRFAWGCGLTTILFTAPTLVAILMGASDVVSAILFIAGELLLIGAFFLLYLRAHRTVKRWKAEQQWTIHKTQVVAASTAPVASGVSPLLTLIPSLPAIAASVWIGIANYAALPERIAIHWDLAGNANGYAVKSPWLIWFVPCLQLFMALIFVGSGAMIRRTRRQLDSADPEASLRRDTIFRGAWTVFCFAMGTLLVAAFVLLQASMFALVHPNVALCAILVVAGLAVVGAVALAIVVGQGGSRLRQAVVNNAEIDRDDDKYWRLGSFYYNPDDPAVFVEKRFGIGFTNNFARPVTWVMLGGLLLFIAAVIIVCFAMGT